MNKQEQVIEIRIPFQFTGEQAYLASWVLEATYRSLWRIYGDEMADFEAMSFPSAQCDFFGVDRYSTGDSENNDF